MPIAYQMKNGGLNVEMVIDGRLQIYFYGCQINEQPAYVRHETICLAET